MADVKLKEGAYDQVRLVISNVMITDAEGDHAAKLPSNELKIKSDRNDLNIFDINSDSISAVSFDFKTDESLHVTGNDKYILAPVVEVQTRDNADVKIKSDNKVEVNGGKVKSSLKVGMDVGGNVGMDVKIDKDKNIIIENDKIKIGIGQS